MVIKNISYNYGRIKDENIRWIKVLNLMVLLTNIDLEINLKSVQIIENPNYLQQLRLQL